MWVKIDDQFPTHPKAIKAGLEARMLFITSLCYSANHLTDGFVTHEVTPLLTAMSQISNGDVAIEKLVEVGLWEVCEGGFMIHDFLVYNPNGDSIRAKRKSNADRQARYRGKSNAVTNAVTNAPSNAYPVPVPVPKKKRVKTAKSEPDPRSQSVEIKLFREITGRYPEKINYDDVISAMSGKTKEIASPFYREWCERGFKPNNLAWCTDWLKSGSIPPKNGNGTHKAEPQPEKPRKVYQ